MRKFTSWLLLLTTYLSFVAPASLTVNAQVLGKSMEQKLQNTPPGLTFRLSEGSPEAGSRTVQPPAQADQLPESESGRVLGRLPAIKTDPDDKAEFAKRVGTLPAPKTGNRIPVKFPADDQRGTPKIVPGTSLQVVRF